MKKIMMILIVMFVVSDLSAEKKPLYFLAAEPEVKNLLSSPDTANLVSEKVIDEKVSYKIGDTFSITYYIIYIVADYQNHLSEYVRGGFITCVGIKSDNPPKSKSYKKFKNNTISTGRNEITPEYLMSYYSFIGWYDLK